VGADQTCAASPHQCLEQADGAAVHCNRLVRVTVGTALGAFDFAKGCRLTRADSARTWREMVTA